MANTTPDNIYYPTRDDMVAPLETVFATAAASVQTAFNTRTTRYFDWVDAAGRNAQTGMRKGDEGRQRNDNSEWLYTGTKWAQFNRNFFQPGTPQQGAAWDGISPIITKVGTIVVTTNSSGVASFPWPGGGFPNGLFAVQFSNGDDAAFGGWYNNRGSTVASATVAAKTGVGAADPGKPVRVNYHATGW